MAPVGCHFTIALVWMRGHQLFEDLAGCRVQFTAPSADPCQRSRSRECQGVVLDNRPKVREHVVHVVRDSLASVPVGCHFTIVAWICRFNC
jgi:hypothetical protein